MATKSKYLVNINGNLRNVTATSKQSAVREAIKMLIRDRLIKTQPKRTLDGWWEGVECEAINE